MINLGQLFEGELPEARLKIKNLANDTLHLTRFAATCSCVLPQQASPLSVAPLSTIDLIVDVKTLGRSGKLTETVSALAQNGSSNLWLITADILPRPPGLPIEISAGEVVIKSDTVVKEFNFAIPGEQITSVTASSSLSQVKVIGSTLDGSCRAIVEFSVPAEEQYLKGSLVLNVNTSQKLNRRFSIPIYLFARSPVAALPERLHIGGIKKGETLKKEITLQFRDEKYKASSVTTSVPWLTANLNATKLRTVIELTVDGSSINRESFEGTCTVMLTPPGLRDLVIPIAGVLLH